MVTPRFPSSTNLFVPQATGQVIAYVRKPGNFKLFDYAQLVKSTRADDSGKPVCVFAILDPDQPARVVTDQEWAWEDGDNSPEGANNLGSFVWQEVRMFRRAYPYRIPEQVDETADWPVMDFHRGIALEQAMTNKTNRVAKLLQTSANWGSNTASANTLNGGRGTWDQASADPSSPNHLAIRRSVLAALQAVNLATNSVVQPKDLVMVIGPALAIAMADTDEIQAYLKNNVYAKANQEGEYPSIQEMWGIPEYYCGIRWIVEDTSVVTERPNAAGTPATTNRSYVFLPTSAALMSRKGGIDGTSGAPSFSTLQIYYYKYELAVEERFDAWHKRVDGRVVDQFQEVLAATRAGYLITSTS